VRPRALVLALGAALALACCAGAQAARVAVGLEEGVSVDAVAPLVEAATGSAVDRSLEPLGVLVISVEDADAAMGALGGLPGVEYLEELKPSRSLSFVPGDPYFPSQWYLEAIRAFDFWDAYPPFAGPVLVAVIDSGIDATHPEFAGRIAAGRSFVNTPWDKDTFGHGTMVAGEIAASTDNAQGIAGLGLPVELLVAKVTKGPGNSISPEAEAKAIKWAVNNGARVINLSLGGPRNPHDTSIDTYSAVEQDAIEYAYSRGAVVVASTGNCVCVPQYPYADYPAALPHVIGVSALTIQNEVAAFSKIDPIFNDLIAPGEGIITTFPVALSRDPSCAGYSPCAQNGLEGGNGTSFSAPLVSAAAALVIATSSVRLDPSQVMAILERTAFDRSPTGRDARTGNGVLDVFAALDATVRGPLPVSDRFETNDDAGASAHRLSAKSPVQATIDAFDDPIDVYGIRLVAGQRVTLRLSGLSGKPLLVLWRTGIKHVTDVTEIAVRSGRVLAYRERHNPALTYRVARTGWYFVEVRAPARGGGAYTLSIKKSR
jgi:subtilisin family serine protease